MITNKDIHEELENAEKVRAALKDEGLKALIKVAIIQTKLLQSIRTNTVSVMRHFKIPLIEPKAKTDSV